MNNYKPLLKLGLPLMSSRFTQVLNTFILMAMLAQLGHTVLAASFTISMFRLVLMLIFMAPLFAVGAIMGRLKGQGSTDNISSLILQSVIIACLLGLLPMVIALNGSGLLKLFHQPAAIIPYVQAYLTYYAFAIPAILMSSALQQNLAGLGLQKYVLLLSVANLGLSIALNDMLIFGHFGLPALGVTGAGLAVLTVSWISLALNTSLLFILKHKQKIHLAKTTLKGFAFGKTILKVGLPIGMQISSEMLSFMLFTMMLGWLGTLALGASQIANEYMMLALVPIFGFSEACTILVGQAHGAHNEQQVKNTGHKGVMIAVGFTLLIGVLFLIAHKPFADIFIHFDQPDAQALYQLALWILALRIITMLFDAPGNVLTGALRGKLDTAYAMKVSLITTWLIGLPAGALLAFACHFGVIGLLLGSAAGRILLALLIGQRWYQGKATH